ncbi:MAG: MBL fold metallo-hydrolase [Gemmatimonadetes bacterium]|nr:MBL fold metallo-hydrolase [Gemmatimonadota bacterium]
MLRVESHGDVQRLHFSTWRSRLVGYSVSCYAVRGVLIDSAFHDVGDELLAWIRESQCRGVIITHAHDDHAGNAERLARAGVPIQLQPDSEALLKTPQRRGPHRWWSWGAMPLLRSPVTPFVAQGLEMVFTPGHSYDHYCVWDADTRTLFAADLFLGVKVRVAHPVHREDVRAQVASIRKAVALGPTRVFDAHRGLLKDGAGLLNAKADWIEQTVAQIDRRIGDGWPDPAIVRDVFGREPLFAYVTLFDWSHANFVASVRRTYPAR